MALDRNQQIALGIAVVAIGIFVIAAIVVGVYFLVRWIRSTPSSSRLPTPVGDMSILTGPYIRVNAVPTINTAVSPAVVISNSTTSTGHIDKDLYHQDQDVYGYYGYRAVFVKSGKIDESKTSNIKWNSTLFKVFDTEDKQDSGFKFRLPKQKGDLVETGVEYQLVATFYDNANAAGEPLYKELVLGKVLSSADSLDITESLSPDVNKLLIQP